MGRYQSVIAESNEVLKLATVLKDRTREPYDFQELVRSRGVFTPSPWVESAYPADPDRFVGEAERAFSTAGWLAMAPLGTFAGLILLPGLWKLAGVLLVVFTSGGGWFWQRERRRVEAQRLAEDDRDKWMNTQTRQRVEHEAAQVASAKAHAEGEAQRAVLRQAVQTGNADPLSELLLLELINEDFPIPVVCEVDFDGLELVDIEYTLPDLSDVPEDRPTILARGDVSRKRISLKDRVEIYEDLCCGIALRLIYETFRVLPMVQQVRLKGIYAETGPTGHDVERVALRLSFSRESFLALDLDRLDPSDAARALGGWACTKKGELRPAKG